MPKRAFQFRVHIPRIDYLRRKILTCNFEDSRDEETASPIDCGSTRKLELNVGEFIRIHCRSCHR